MPKTLTFLHTSPVHIETFNRLLTELAPDIPVQHIVDESLLDEARARGEMTPELNERVKLTIMGAVDEQAHVVLCTCSTIGASAESVDQLTPETVMRVDRPMAEKAVALGSRIIIAATLASTLAPTRELVMAAARDAGKSIHIVEVVCEAAWDKFERGDKEGSLEEIAETLQKAESQGDVIVLAQASMAEAAARCGQLSIPVLSSPRLGVEAAIGAYRA